MGVLRELRRKLLPDRNQRLSSQNWWNLSPSSARRAGKARRPPKQDSDALRYPTCVLKSSDSSTMLCTMVLRTTAPSSSENSFFYIPVLSSVGSHAQMTDKVRLAQLPFRTPTDPWSHTVHKRLLTGQSGLLEDRSDSLRRLLRLLRIQKMPWWDIRSIYSWITLLGS